VNDYLTTTLPAVTDPVAVAARIAASTDGPYVVYEDETGLGCALGALTEITVETDRVTVRRGEDDLPVSAVPPPGRPLHLVDRYLREADVSAWRAYGTATFELALLHAGLPVPASEGPLAHIVVPRTEVRFEPGQTMIRSVSAAAADAVAALVTAPAGDLAGTPQPVSVEHAAAQYLAAVSAGRDAIRSGALQKIILSRVVPVDFPVDLPATFVAGRRRNTPARSFLLRLGGLGAVGFSPEIVVRVEPDGLVRTQPLAGTRALHPNDEQASRLRTELLTNDKEIYEHAISVKVAFDELAGLCEPGTVRVADYMTVHRRGTVQHLGSSVAGQLAGGRRWPEALAALLPAVTASGVPKREAYDWIARLETAPRGLYSGAVFTIGHDGCLDAAVVLRTLFSRGGRAWLRAGAGIVAASVPERELEETREKLMSVASYVMPAVTPALTAP
jgi:salicylate synthetase